MDKPKHWVDREELNPEYWADPKTQELRAQEFLHKPIETLEKIEKLDTQGFARREFLTIMGASMAMASFACARRPVHKIIPYVVKPEPVTPGVANYYASTCQECSVGCGVLVKTRESRPIKLEGNPDHALNHGKLCGRGQASLLNLYDPDRIQAVFQQNRGQAGATQSTWLNADSQIVAKLSEARARGLGVRILTSGASGSSGPSSRRLFGEFLSQFSDGRWVDLDPLALPEIGEAQELSYGASGDWTTPRYRFENAEIVLSLGADFLGTWQSPVEYQAAWSKRRKLEGQPHKQARMSKNIVFESQMSVTGANSDLRFGVRPGDELSVGLAIAHELVITRKVSSLASNSTVVALLKDYKPEAVASAIGGSVTSSKLKEIAEDLWKNRGKSLVVAGGLGTRSGAALSLQIVTNLLNSILENDGKTVDASVAPKPREHGVKEWSQLIADMNSGRVGVLVLHRANPVYQLPLSAGFVEALKKVPFVVAIDDRVTETAKHADWVLPSSHYLEDWGDAQPTQGLYSLQQPVIAPMYDTRGLQECLLVWVKGLKLSAGLASQIASTNEGDFWHRYLSKNWEQSFHARAGAGLSFNEFWERTLEKGVLDLRGSASGSGSRSFRMAALDLVRKPALAPAPGQLTLGMYVKVAAADGRSANNAWLQEMPDPVSTATWDNYLNISPALANRLNIQTNDVVRVRVEGGESFEIPAHVQPGLHADALTVAVGFGRTAAGKVGNGVGVNVFPFTRFEKSEWVFSGAKAELAKTGKRYELALTQSHHRTENRPIINDVSLAEYHQSAKAEMHTTPHLRMETVPSIWPKHEYKGFRWGMAIDLNSCTGCNACVIACQAENNIPVVGRDNVRKGREMHWIRLDRYYSGSAENPEVVFQPMLCQHCENASCETVCPVLATVHSSEGLNDQAYNRCVGTRYCQNNCPYKVRRFNFFDHWKSYEGPMNLVWNPDVTVRTRGIMEKCTFCVQRIAGAKDDAKRTGVALKDGDIKTACQQTCPSDAIVFGDINDPNSRVSKLRADDRAFRSLEDINNKPSISYLTKVRNRVSEGDTHEHG